MKHATLLILLLLTIPCLAQEKTPLTVRDYSAPEQRISMDGDTPFNKAVTIFSNAFKRFEQRPLVYDGNIDKPISVNIPNMHWRDAFDLVMRMNNHWYVDNQDYVRIVSLTKDAVDTTRFSSITAMSTKEVEISAIFFEANRTAMDQLGIDWNITNQTPTSKVQIGVENVGYLSQQRQQTTQTQNQQGTVDYGMTTQITTAYKAANLLAALRAFQSQNLGELISSPSITVRSGQEGRIQVGQDFSIKQRDFSGNTTDQFFSTGTIITVTPSVMERDSIEFVHLEIMAERSSVFPDPISTIINKTEAKTYVLLMNGEETIVGGLYTNDMKSIRRGVPFLKDLPWWMFGLRYIFGYDEDEVTKKELIIILKARILPSLKERMALKALEIQQGQRALQNEMDRVEAMRNALLDQIETAKANRK